MTQTLISAVEGNSQRLDGGAMFGNAPKALWTRWIQPDDQNRIPLACRALLIEHGDQKILCETGIGAFFEPQLAERYGVEKPDTHVLLESLKSLNITEDQIDTVILSHLHFDHAGGLFPSYAEKQKGREDLLFPKARYMVGKEAWERAMHPHPRDRASFIPELQDKLQKSGRLTLVEGDHVPGYLVDRLKFRISNGHTPGQMHTSFRGEKQTVFFCGDLIPGSAWVHLPITMGYDRYPEKLIEEKTELYESVALKEKWLLFFTHDPVYRAAMLKKDEKGRYSADPSLEKLERKAL